MNLDEAIKQIEKSVGRISSIKYVNNYRTFVQSWSPNYLQNFVKVGYFGKLTLNPKTYGSGLNIMYYWNNYPVKLFDNYDLEKLIDENRILEITEFIKEDCLFTQIIHQSNAIYNQFNAVIEFSFDGYLISP